MLDLHDDAIQHRCSIQQCAICCRGRTASLFAATALISCFCMAGASLSGGLFTAVPESMELSTRTLQQAEPALDALNPKCFWAGGDCKADVDALFPDFSLYFDVISHRANATVCLSWTKESAGDCRTGATIQLTDSLQDGFIEPSPVSVPLATSWGLVYGTVNDTLH